MESNAVMEVRVWVILRISKPTSQTLIVQPSSRIQLRLNEMLPITKIVDLNAMRISSNPSITIT